MSFLQNNWFKLIVVKQAKWLIGLIVFCLILASGIGWAIPQLISELYQSLQVKADFEQVLIFLVSVFIVEYLNSAIYQLAINKYIQKMILQIRSNAFRKWLFSFEMQKQGVKEHEKEYPLGEVLARIVSDTEAVAELIHSGSFAIFIDLFFVLSCFVSFLTLNFVSGFSMMISEALAVVGLIYGSKYIARVFYRVRKENGVLSRKLADLTSGISQSYYTDHQGYASLQGGIYSDRFLKVQLNANVWDASYYSLAESLFPIMLVLLALIFPFSGIAKLAVIAALIDLIQRSINPIKSIASKISSIQRAFSGIRRIDEFTTQLTRGHLSLQGNDNLNFKLHQFKMDLKKFAYEKYDHSKTQRTDFMLQDIAFEAKPGELVGIVGFSGCGKSTLVNIITGNLLPDFGNVQLISSEQQNIFLPSKNDLRDQEEGGEELHAYRQLVSIVSQESHLFSETLEFNITMNLPGNEKTFLGFWQMACKKISYLEEWGIAPNYIVVVENLSVGQKQLLAALRAAFLKRPIVVFDEISSSLDSKLEEALRKMILLIQEHSLTLIVAHRLETIIKADNIIVLNDGKMEAQGQHTELLNLSPSYQSFINHLRNPQNENF
ncbi:MAG: ATP-binding cassette domain-containing protein [Bacteriovoracia bacterium]